METLIKAAFTVIRYTRFKTWKRNTHDPLLILNCIRSMMIGVFNIVDGLIVILTLGFYKPEFSTSFLMETIKRRMEEDETT